MDLLRRRSPGMRTHRPAARFTIAVVASALAIAVVGALSHAGGGAQAAPSPERLQPVSFEGHLGRATRRRLPVVFTTGVCADGLRFSTLREGKRSVSIRLDEVFRGTEERPCILLAKYRCVTIVLRKPLGHRRVLDQAPGVAIPPQRERRTTDCPRVPAPPADLPPSRT
jgi:hypothetical protein